MSPRRGDRAAPPPVPGEYDLRFAGNDDAADWEQLAAQAPGNLRRAFDAIRADPRSRPAPERQHRLKGSLVPRPDCDLCPGHDYSLASMSASRR